MYISMSMQAFDIGCIFAMTCMTVHAPLHCLTDLTRLRLPFNRSRHEKFPDNRPVRCAAALGGLARHGADDRAASARQPWMVAGPPPADPFAETICPAPAQGGRSAQPLTMPRMRNRIWRLAAEHGCASIAKRWHLSLQMGRRARRRRSLPANCRPAYTAP